MEIGRRLVGLVGVALTRLIEGRFETGRKPVGRTVSPVMEEDHNWLVTDHVVMNGDNVQSVRAQSFQGWTSPAITASSFVP